MADKNINPNNDPAKHALRISLYYLLFSSVWVIITDFLNVSFQNDDVNEYLMEVGKGLLFVIVTAIILYAFLKKYFNGFQNKAFEVFKKEEEFRILAENLEVGIIKHAPDGRYIYINTMALGIFKEFMNTLLSKDIIGKLPDEVYCDNEILKRVKNILNYVRTNKTSIKSKTRYGNKYFSITTYPELDVNGELISILSIITDETEVMESMSKLEETEKFNSQLVNSSYVIVYLYDIKNRTNLFINNALSKILGYTPEEIRKLGKQFEITAMHPDDIAAFTDYMKNTIPHLKDEKVSEFEHRMKHKNGTYRWIRSTDMIFKRDSEGKPEIILGHGIDITEIKIIQDELQRKTDYLNTVIEASPIAIYDVNTDGEVGTIWNKATEEMFGWTAEEVIGKTLPFITPDIDNDYKKNLNILNEGGILNGSEYLRYTKNGSPINIRVYARPVKDRNGKTETILSYNENITLEKKFEESKINNEKYLKTLYEASIKASNTFNNKELYKECFTYIDEILKVTSIMISLVTEDGKYVKYDAVRVNGVDVDVNNIPLMKLEKNGKGPLTRTIFEGSSRVIGDLEESAKSSKNKFFIDTDGKLQDLEGDVKNVSRSAIMIPLKYADKVIGVLQVQNIFTGVYSDKDLLKLEPFAFIFASAINRSRLYNKLQNELAEKAAAFDQVRKFSKGIEQSPNSIIITNSNTEIEYVNPYFTELTGYTMEETLGKNPRFLQSGHTTKEIYGELWKKLLNKEVWHGEFLNRKKNGELFWEAASIGPILDNAGNVTHYIAIKQDISEKKKKDKELKDTLLEKEIMLKEIHHRVKNNLQVISSLLNMQVEQYEHPEAIDAINSSRNRVKAMALVHESLYQSRNIGKTDFKEYILKLAKNIYSSYGVSMERVMLNINSNSIEFGLDTIIPLGLILNEAISNCLKHAFPGDSTGEITLDLTSEKIEEDESGRCENFRLEIKDTGKGLPDDFDPYKTNSLGMTLLTSLSSQLDGEAFFINGSGTKIVINFKELTYSKRM